MVNQDGSYEPTFNPLSISLDTPFKGKFLQQSIKTPTMGTGTGTSCRHRDREGAS
jgi:hypothetical protein